MLETPALERESSDVQVETSSKGNVTLTNVNVEIQGGLGEGDLWPLLYSDDLRLIDKNFPM